MRTALIATVGRLFQFLVLDEGSTRGVALIRIGLVGLLWSKWADMFLVYRLQFAEPATVVIGVSFYLSTVLLLFGIGTRFASAWAGVTVLAIYHWMGTGDLEKEIRHHHTALLVLATVLLAFTPSGGSWSVDRWWAVRWAEQRGEPIPPERGPLWGQRLIALQVSVLYLATATNKCTPGFLNGSGLQHNLMPQYFGSDYPAWPWFPHLTQASAIATVILEFSLGLGLWFRRCRRWLIPIGLVFHGVLYVLLPVSTFTLTMWVLYIAFIDPDDLHAFIDRLGGARRATT